MKYISFLLSLLLVLSFVGCDKAKDTAKDVKDVTTEAVGNAVDTAGHAVDTAKEAVEDAIEGAGEAVDDAKDTVHDAAEEMTDSEKCG